MTQEPMTYDPLSPDSLADPMAATAPLREGCPVHHFDGFEPPFYTLARHEDVLDALKDVETFSSRYGQGPHFTEERGMKSDPPTHTFFRRLVSKAFTARAVREMEGRIEAIVDELLDAFADRGEGDLHEHLAFPLPTIVIAEMLGVPESDRLRFKGWSDAWVAAMSAADPTPYEAEIASMRAYLLAAVRDRRAIEESGRELPDDLISALVVAEEHGEHLRDEDVAHHQRPAAADAGAGAPGAGRGRSGPGRGGRRGEPAPRRTGPRPVPYDDVPGRAPRRGDPRRGEGDAPLRLGKPR